MEIENSQSYIKVLRFIQTGPFYKKKTFFLQDMQSVYWCLEIQKGIIITWCFMPGEQRLVNLEIHSVPGPIQFTHLSTHGASYVSEPGSAGRLLLLQQLQQQPAGSKLLLLSNNIYCCVGRTAAASINVAMEPAKITKKTSSA